jgi:2-succinyl-5-enolpyruvyl-6-hydroxy-3-cyclohexene-1-carboxylate synthase
VISPGSRSTPIIIALSRHHGISLIPVVDERAAAFFALGMAQQLQCASAHNQHDEKQPSLVGLLCTSGTAVLNYAPAIAEAYYQKIPLIVLTADRPKEWIDQQDGQTIRQPDVYRNFIVKSFELPVEINSENDLWLSDRTVNEAINTACIQKGPVHINIPLREPLNKQIEIHAAEKPKIIAISTAPLHDPGNVNTIISNTKHRKILILGGSGYFKFKYPNQNNIVLLAEITCNINVPAYKNLDALVHAISIKSAADYRPDLLITFGGAIISKKMKEFLRAYAPSEHWHLSTQMEHIDTFQRLTRVLPYSVESIMAQLEKLPAEPNNYQTLWNNLSAETNRKINEFISKAPFSDLKAYHHTIKHLSLLANRLQPEPDQQDYTINLQLGNSTPVRYAAYFHIHEKILVNSNRGVSGIDGTVSTACGAAHVNNKLTVLITGDLAFMYDSNGLWNPHLSENFRAIVMNNSGGNIFRIINDEHNLPELCDYFETPHQYRIESVCESVNVPYYFCDTEDGLLHKLETFFEPTGKPAVLEIKTNGKLSAEVYKNLLATLQS